MRFHCGATNFERSSLMGRKSYQWYTVRRVSWNSSGFNAFTTLPWLDHPHSCEDKKHVHPIHLQVTLCFLICFKRTFDRGHTPQNSYRCRAWKSRPFKSMNDFIPHPQKKHPTTIKSSPQQKQCTNSCPFMEMIANNAFSPKLISNKSSPKPMPLAPRDPVLEALGALARRGPWTHEELFGIFWDDFLGKKWIRPEYPLNSTSIYATFPDSSWCMILIDPFSTSVIVGS